MEDLLKLIASNPLLVIIILGAIYKFFQSGQQSKSETRKKQKKKAEPRHKQQPVTTKRSQPQQTLGKNEEDYKQNQQKDSPIYNGDLTASSKLHLDFSKMSREDVMKGVILSEILGKPRAKAAYRPISYSRRKQG